MTRCTFRQFSSAGFLPAIRTTRPVAIRALGILGDRESLPLVLECLDGDDVQRCRVARALGGMKAEKELKALLDDVALSVRIEAARSLRRMGSRDGAMALVGFAERGFTPLFSAEKLSATTFRGTLKANARTVLVETAKRAAMPIEFSAGLTSYELAWLESSEREATSKYGRMSLEDVVAWCLYDAPVDVLVDDGKLRVVTSAEALAWWKARLK